MPIENNVKASEKSLVAEKRAVEADKQKAQARTAADDERFAPVRQKCGRVDERVGAVDGFARASQRVVGHELPLGLDNVEHRMPSIDNAQYGLIDNVVLPPKKSEPKEK